MGITSTGEDKIYQHFREILKLVTLLKQSGFINLGQARSKGWITRIVTRTTYLRFKDLCNEIEKGCIIQVRKTSGASSNKFVHDLQALGVLQVTEHAT